MVPHCHSSVRFRVILQGVHPFITYFMKKKKKKKGSTLWHFAEDIPIKKEKESPLLHILKKLKTKLKKKWSNMKIKIDWRDWMSLSKRQMDLLILNTPRRQHWTWADLRLWPRAHEWVLSVSLKFWCDLWTKKIIIESWEVWIQRACKALQFTTAHHQRRSPSDEWSLLPPQRELILWI